VRAHCRLQEPGLPSHTNAQALAPFRMRGRDIVGGRLSCLDDGQPMVVVCIGNAVQGVVLDRLYSHARAFARPPRFGLAAARRAAATIAAALASTPITNRSGSAAAVASTYLPSPVPRSIVTAVCRASSSCS